MEMEKRTWIHKGDFFSFAVCFQILSVERSQVLRSCKNPKEHTNCLRKVLCLLSDAVRTSTAVNQLTTLQRNGMRLLLESVCIQSVHYLCSMQLVLRISIDDPSA
jgi:hypothetical protein